VFRHLFRREDGRWVLFLWTSAGHARVTVTLPHGLSTLTEIGLDGADLSTRAIGGTRLESILLTAEQPRTFELIP
jgi:hypothetical protein